MLARCPIAACLYLSAFSLALATPQVEQIPRLSGAASNPDDPNQDGWATEAFSQQAQGSLKKLAAFLNKRKEITEDSVSAWASPQFAGGPLRPSDDRLQAVFEDQTVSVYRGQPMKDEGAQQGKAALAEALNRLVEPYSNAAELRTFFKLFRVEPHDAQVATSVYYEAFASGGAEEFQEVALWRCFWSRPEADVPPRLLRIEVQDYEKTVLKATVPKTLFADATASVLAGNPSYRSQILHGAGYWSERIHNIVGTDYFGHQGLAVGDANGDGLDDLYLCQTGGIPNRLFVQQPDGTARDTSQEAGVDWLDRSRSALFLDLDNDGDQDLAVAAERHLLLLANDGKGRFTLKSKLDQVRNAYSLAAADYDLDGDLDIYACHYFPRQAQERHFPAPVPYHNARNGGRNVLLRNEGKWRWKDVTEETGLEESNQRWSFAAAWEDYDDDGDADLYVANDFGQNNLFRNSAGRFEDVSSQAGLQDGAFGMSASWGDYDRDGKMDLYVGNMWSSAGHRVTFQPRFKSDAPEDLKEAFQRLSQGNTLFQSLGDGTFKDSSLQAAVKMGRWSWGSRFVDLNNDGWQDLVVANGYISAADTRDL